MNTAQENPPNREPSLQAHFSLDKARLLTRCFYSRVIMEIADFQRCRPLSVDAPELTDAEPELFVGQVDPGPDHDHLV